MSDRLSGQQARAPAEPGRERDLGVFHRHQPVEDQLVERAVEIAAAIQEPFGDRQRLGESCGERRAHLVDERLHCRIGRQQVGEHRQQHVAEIRDLAAFDVEIEHAEELAVRAGVGHQRLAARVLHDDRGGDAVVRVPAQDRVDAAHARGHLEIDVHAVVRQQHDGLGALGARLVDRLLHRLFLDAEIPFGNEVARVGDRRVGKRLADDRDRHAVHPAHRVRREHRIAEVGGLDVLRDELDPPLEIVVDDLLDALRAQGEFPVPGHQVDAEQFLRLDHVLALGPQRRRRALPGVAAVEQQRAGTRRLELLDQRRKMREAAELAVGPGGLFEVEIGEGVRVSRSGLDPESAQERFAHEVRRPAGHPADAQD